MNCLHLKKINLLLILLFFSIKGISQNIPANSRNIIETVITSGNNATGNSGSVSYSIGQVFYTYIGLSSVYNVAQGIQHPELSKTPVTPGNSELTPEIFIFPNPTTDFVNVNVKGLEFEKTQQSYQLYDLQGRLIKQNSLKQAETQISLSNLSSSIYILRIYANKKVLKTFKIIKK